MGFSNCFSLRTLACIGSASNPVETIIADVTELFSLNFGYTGPTPEVFHKLTKNGERVYSCE